MPVSVSITAAPRQSFSAKSFVPSGDAALTVLNDIARAMTAASITEITIEL
jgi:hypothetical protein